MEKRQLLLDSMIGIFSTNSTLSAKVPELGPSLGISQNGVTYLGDQIVEQKRQLQSTEADSLKILRGKILDHLGNVVVGAAIVVEGIQYGVIPFLP